MHQVRLWNFFENLQLSSIIQQAAHVPELSVLVSFRYRLVKFLNDIMQYLLIFGTQFDLIK